jgi:TonB family protein
MPRNRMQRSLAARSLFIAACLAIHGTGIYARAQQPQQPQQQPAALSSKERERGVNLYKQNDTKGAIRELRAAVKNRQDDADAWYFLALALNRDNDLKGARKAFETAIQLRPNLANAHTGLAYILLLNDKLKDASREAASALALDAGNAEAHYILGIAALRRGANQKALEEAVYTLKLKESFTPALLLKSQALANLYFSHYEFPGEESPAARHAQIKDAVASLEQYLKVVQRTSDNALKGSEQALWGQQLDELRFYEELADKASPENARAVFAPSEVAIKAKILSRPEPQYTEEARNHSISGTVILRAVLAADGLIKHIVVARSLSNGLTEASVRAARQIKFIPAQKDGHPVSQYVQIEYNFSVY